MRRGRAAFLRGAGRALAAPVERAARRSGRHAGVALVYHRVGEPPGDPARELLPALGTRLFAEQVAYLASRYSLVKASELVRAAAERRPGERFPVAITFDDDLRSHVEVAAPVLRRAGARATFFLTGAALAGPYRFWWERLQQAHEEGLDLAAVGPFGAGGDVHALGRAAELLPPRELEEVDRRLRELAGPDPDGVGLRAPDVARLAQEGFEIGFHTRRHYRLPGLEDEELARTLAQGREELEAAAGHPLETIAYPHGAADARVADAARAAGFSAGFTGMPGAVTPACDPLLLGRVSPSYASVGELAFAVASALARPGSR